MATFQIAPPEKFNLTNGRNGFECFQDACGLSQKGVHQVNSLVILWLLGLSDDKKKSMKW